MLPLAATAFVGGICLLQAQPSLPPLFGALLLLSLLPAVAYPKSRNVALLLLMCGGGFYYAAWRAEARLAQTVPAAVEWRDIVVEGVVRGFADDNGGRTRFDFAIEKIVQPEMPLKLRVRLSDYHYGQPPLAGLANNARLRLKVRIRPPPSAVNPRGFDYAGYLFSRGIRGSGYVRARASAVVLQKNDGWRDKLRRRALALPHHGETVAALIVGDRSAIDEAQWEALRRTGTAHLLSISGTHITLVASFVALLAGFLWRRSGRLLRLMPAQKAALLAAIPAALGYAWLGGFGVPVQRSFLMFGAAALALLGGGRTSTAQVMALAALVVTAADPWSVLAAGFWLSFMLAAAVVYAAVNYSHTRLFCWHLLRLQFLVSVLAMPLTLWFFNEASLVSPVANALAIPLVGFVVLPLALLDVLLPGEVLWHAAGWLLTGFWNFIETLSGWVLASWRAAAPWWLFVLACIGGGWLLMPAGVPLRWAGILPITALALWLPPTPAVGAYRMTVLDVGQGTSVLIETAGKVMIYDAGPKHAFAAIDGALRSGGHRRIDMLMLSHEDSDHIGAAARVLRQYMPARIYSSLPPAHPLAAAPHVRCMAGQQWQWDEVDFQVLHPPAGYGESSDNEESCVLKISAAGGAALLTGDISATIERRIIGRSPQADVLLASHHGSRYSSAGEFLQAVAPQAVVFSAGATNNYGHPHPQVLARVQAAGAKIYRTDRDGAIVIEVHEQLNIIKWREQQRRYWHENQHD